MLGLLALGGLLLDMWAVDTYSPRTVAKLFELATTDPRVPTEEARPQHIRIVAPVGAIPHRPNFLRIRASEPKGSAGTTVTRHTLKNRS